MYLRVSESAKGTGGSERAARKARVLSCHPRGQSARPLIVGLTMPREAPENLARNLRTDRLVGDEAVSDLSAPRDTVSVPRELAARRRRSFRPPDAPTLPVSGQTGDRRR